MADQFLSAADWARALTEELHGGPADCYCVPAAPKGHHLSMVELDGEVMVAARCRTCGGIRGIGVDPRSSRFLTLRRIYLHACDSVIV